MASKKGGSKKKGSAAPSVAVIGLAAIVAATIDEAVGFLFVPTDEANALAADGLVETNPAVAGPEGQVATRATQKGIDTVNAQNAAVETAAAAGDAAVAAEKPKFVIDDNVPIPSISGRGRTGSVYPFDALEVGQSFFVAKPAKNLASTVSSANARYAEPLTNEDGTPVMRKNRKGEDVPATKQTRTFIVRSVEGGSRIWRKA